VDNFSFSEKKSEKVFEEKKRGKTKMVFPQTPFPRKKDKFATLTWLTKEFYSTHRNASLALCSIK